PPNPPTRPAPGCWERVAQTTPTPALAAQTSPSLAVPISGPDHPTGHTETAHPRLVDRGSTQVSMPAPGVRLPNPDDRASHRRMTAEGNRAHGRSRRKPVHRMR